jgi:hypothetical protein
MAIGGMVLLFSYGTLRLEDVQIGTFGRKLKGKPDTLPGFALSTVLIRNADVIELSGAETHLIAKPTGDRADRIDGTVFEITEDELARADSYETDDYVREEVVLASGRRAFVYLAASPDAGQDLG